MGMLDTFRTAWELAKRVDELEKEHDRIQNEWEDTLNRLKVLTGRLAKRDQRDVQRDLASATEPTVPQLVPTNTKASLRARAAQAGHLHEGTA